MEGVVIPSRVPGQAPYRYTWDANGSVRRVERLSQLQIPFTHLASATPSDVDSVSAVSQPDTVQWPFHHPTSSSSAVSSFRNSYLASPLWPPPPLPLPPLLPLPPPVRPPSSGRFGSMLRPGTATSLASIVPDYVRNFLRGETPETLARRRADTGPSSIDSATTFNVAAAMPIHYHNYRQHHQRRPTGMDMPAIAAPHPALLAASARRGARARPNFYSPASSEFGADVDADAEPDAEAYREGDDEQRILRGSSGTPRPPPPRGPPPLSSARRILASGWRAGVALNCLIAFFALMIVLVGLIVTISSSSSSPTPTSSVSSNAGRAVIFAGPCSRAYTIARGLFTLAAVFGVAAIAGANYVLQVLTSPTRAELDRAHGSGRWLDIGIPSARNLAAISSWRVVALSCITLMAVVGQIMYNSIISVSHLVAAQHDPADPVGPSSCQVTANGPILGAAALVDLFTVLALVVVMTRSRFEPLASVGDALASFLQAPDRVTAGACLVTKADIRRGGWHFGAAKYWVPSGFMWAQAVSPRRWALWIVAWAVAAALTVAALATALHQDGSSSTAVTPMGGGSRLTSGILLRFSPGTSCGALAVIAALPQAILAGLYFVTNAHMSTYFLSHELSQFAAGAVPKAGGRRGIPLRVTSGRPIGEQIPSLYLTLPRPWSWLLMILFAAASLLLSQSLVAVTTTTTKTAVAGGNGGSGGPDVAALAALALVPGALAGLLTILVAIALVVVGQGLRRAQPVPAAGFGQSTANPLVLRGGACSAVISARAHPLEHERGGDASVAGRRIAWGVVKEGEEMHASHASFSSGPVGVLSVGRNYA